MKKSPHIAVLTNLAPNHLDIHTDMDEYIRAKAAVLDYQGPGDRAVCNWDNEITRNLSDRTAGKVSFFTRISVVPAHTPPLPGQLNAVLHPAEAPCKVHDGLIRHQTLDGRVNRGMW